MVRFIKTFIYHHSIDLLTDKERKINVIFQIIIVTFFYIFLSTMMTFKQNYEFFIPIFVIGISFCIPEFIFKIFLKKIDKYYNVYDKIRPDKFSFDGYALENLIRGISVSSSFLIFFIAIKATLPGFCVAFSMIYTVTFIFLRRKKYWEMFEPRFEEDPDPVKLRKFINILSGEGGVICGCASVGACFYLIIKGVILKITAIGADISRNDVSCSNTLVENIESDLYKLKALGARDAALTNVTGDDVVVSAFVEDDLLESVNEGIVNILKDNAENLGDLSGISQSPDTAGEGISYAEASIRQDRYPDAIVLGFDTYGGESFVGDAANSAIEAAKGMKNMTDVSDLIEPKSKKIPGVGYVSPETDDPVVVATVENIESVGVIAGAMIGAALGNKNVYLVKRGTNCNVLPGSVIFSATAFMNGNVIDLAVPFENKTRILR